MKIFELFGSIFVESDQANESLDKTDSKAKNIATSLGNGIKTAAAWSTAVVGGAVAVGGAMLKAGEKFAETTDRIDKMSQKLGLSREGFQEWEFILSQSGASIDSMKRGMATLTEATGDLINGTGKGADAFAQLGLSLDDVKGKSQEEIFEMTIKGLQGIEDAGDRARIANDLLGKTTAAELTPLLNSGADAIENMKNQANEMGMVIGDDAIDAGVKFTDTLDQVKRTIKGLATGLMAGLMPTLQMFLEFVQDNMPLIQGVIQDVFKVLSSAVESVMPLLMQLIQTVLPPLIGLFAELASGVIPILVDTVTMLITNVLPILIELFTALITSILPPLMDILSIIVTTVLPPLIELFTTIITLVLPPLIELFNVLVETLLPPLIELFNIIIENVMPIIIELFNVFIETVLPPLIELIDLIVKEILPPLLAIFMELAQAVLPLVMDVFRAMMPVIEPIMNAIAAVIKTVLALIKGDWEGVWDGIKEFFTSILDAIVAYVEGFSDIFAGIFQGLADVIGGIWDGIVASIKGAINFIISGINTFINGVNKVKVPDWVPGVGGKGINISTIPLLAEGGDILESGKVIVGDAGPEMLELRAGARVTPLDRKPQESSTEEKSVKNEFNIAQLVVREEADIKKIAKELFRLQQQNGRPREVLV